jgi:phage gp16-like protein
VNDALTPAGLRDLFALAEESGFALVPLQLDADMRRAIWDAWAARHIQTPAHRAQAAAARLTNAAQTAEDEANWQAIIGEAKRRFEAK